MLHGACTERVVLTDSLSGLWMLCWCWQESLVTDSKYWPVHHCDPLSTSVRPEANIYVSIFFPQAVRIHQPCMSCLHRFHILHIHCIIYTTNHLIINNLPQRSSSLITLWHTLYSFALSSLHDVTLAALSNVHYTVYIYCPVCIYWKKRFRKKKAQTENILAATTWTFPPFYYHPHLY